MQKIIQTLDRWRKRKVNNNSIIVTPVDSTRLPAAVLFAYEYLREAEAINDPNVIANIFDRFQNCFMGSGATDVILMALATGKPAGIVIVGLVEPSMADSRTTGGISFLYVSPEYRNTDDVVVALLRAAGAKLLESGCKALRITVDAAKEKLVHHYVDMLGFAPTHHLLICEVKED